MIDIGDHFHDVTKKAALGLGKNRETESVNNMCEVERGKSPINNIEFATNIIVHDENGNDITAMVKAAVANGSTNSLA